MDSQGYAFFPPKGAPSWWCQVKGEGKPLPQHLEFNPHCTPMLLLLYNVELQCKEGPSETGSTSSTGTGSWPLSRRLCVRIYPSV